MSTRLSLTGTDFFLPNGLTFPTKDRKGEIRVWTEKPKHLDKAECVGSFYVSYEMESPRPKNESHCLIPYDDIHELTDIVAQQRRRLFDGSYLPWNDEAIAYCLTELRKANATDFVTSIPRFRRDTFRDERGMYQRIELHLSGVAYRK